MSIDDRIDELYTLSPEEFVAARDALVQGLRGEGDREGAARVKALRRPSVAAWAVNQVARRHPEEIAELLAAGADLREAQRAAMSGKGKAHVHELVSRRRSVVERLARRGRDVLEGAGRGSDAHVDAMADTFIAASVEDAVVDLVRAGRLDRERKPSSDLADLLGVPADELAGRERGAAAERKAVLETAERDARRARQDADRAAKRAEQLKRAAREAREQADRRARSADEAEDEATVAREMAEAAEAELLRLRRKR